MRLIGSFRIKALPTTAVALTPITLAGESAERGETAYAGALNAALLAWKGRPRSCLNGTSQLTRVQVVSHKHGALGRRYYGEGLTAYNHLRGMRALEAPHVELHRVIREVVGHHEAGQWEEAEAAFAQVEPRSQRIGGLLDAGERSAQGQQAALPAA